MLYIERQPTKQSVLLLIALAAVLYLGALLLPELRAGDEAVHAAIARDIVGTGQFLKTSLYGQPIKSYPLYSWLVVLCSGFQSPNLFTLRLPSVLALWGMAWLAGVIGRRIQSAFAGWIAAAVVLTSAMGLVVGVHAQAEILQAFFLFAAWYAWFHLGVEQKRWGAAWGIAHGLVFLAILAVGGKALFWFYFPLLFMRRPLNALKRMQMPAHLVSMTALGLVIVVWLYVTPNQPFMPWNTEPGLIVSSRQSAPYLLHFVSFPIKSILYLGAWGLFVWAPFCIALRQFEMNHPCCLFCRTLVTAIFTLIWLWPGTSPLQLLMLLGPIAVLIGVHFEIVIRRYQHILSRILRAAAWGIVVAGLLLSMVWGCLAGGVMEIVTQHADGVFLKLSALVCVFLLGMVLIVYGLILRKGSHLTFRSGMLWCIVGVRVLVICSWYAWNNWAGADRRLAGRMLSDALKTDVAARAEESAMQTVLKGQKETAGLFGKQKDSVVYFLPSRDYKYLCLVETFFIGHRICRIDDLKELPESEKTVYVLSSRAPALATRQWEAVSGAVDLAMKQEVRKVPTNENRRLPLLKLARQPIKEEHQEHPLLIYRGINQ